MSWSNSSPFAGVAPRSEAMLDLRLRGVKERVLEPTAGRLARWMGPTALTVASLTTALATAALAWADLRWLALTAWLISRLFDGLDGPVARARDQATDFGGYLDIVGDTIGYAVVPLGVALGVDERTTWIALAVLLASFFVNSISWTYLAAVLEKRGEGAASTGEMTTVTMRPALIEGTETIVLFSLFIAFPALAAWWFATMAALVSVNVVQRLAWARGALS